VKIKGIWVVVGLCLVGLGVVAQHDSTGATTSQVASKAVADGVYTARQADRGKAIYTAQCAMCHGANLVGGSAPVLAGNAALTRWKEKTVADVFNAIKARMPLTKPGSLTAQQAADVTAYILQFNKFKAGNSLLPQDAKALSDIAFDKTAQEAAIKAAQAAQQAQANQNTQTAATPAGGPRTVANGVYSVAQANRGKAAYTNPSNACSGCHGADLGGSPGGPSLVRGSFKLNWGGKSVADLFNHTKTRMPPGRAGTLEESAYIDIMAYILQANGYPAGTNELTTNMDDLKQIAIPK
jgi:S-disulfanyl-L-cysteine oxidoreductase SoxD